MQKRRWILSGSLEIRTEESARNGVLGASRNGRAQTWLERLAIGDVQPALGVPAVLSAEVELGGHPALAFAIVPDPSNRFPRARHGEMGLEQSLALAACVRAAIDGSGKPLLAIVDTPGQALGRIEEAHCLSSACAASVEAYAFARRAGHPVFTLVVGKAMSGSFLAHGMQSDAILAFDDSAVSMHAMSARSIARITRRTLAQVEKTAAAVAPMSYAIADAYRLGIIDELLPGIQAEQPSDEDVQKVNEVLSRWLQQVREAGGGARSLQENRLRAATLHVRQSMREQWATADRTLRKVNP